jgi:glycerol-3-phosphate cytidylyltransferase-like family protein
VCCDAVAVAAPAGHLEFFKQARALGDYLIVSFASDAVLAGHKQGRRSSIPTEHKKALIGSLRMVDEVVVGEGQKAGEWLTAWVWG